MLLTLLNSSSLFLSSTHLLLVHTFMGKRGSQGALGVQWRLPIGWTAEISDRLSCAWGGGPTEVSFLPSDGE